MWWIPYRPGDFRVALRDAVDEAAQVEGERGHVQPAIVIAEHPQHRCRNHWTERSFDETPLEAVVASGNGRVRGEDAVAPDLFGAPGRLRPICVARSQELERRQGGVTLVQVIATQTLVSRRRE